MSTALKVISLLAKGLAIVVMLDWTTLSPKWGVLIFAAASTVKDVVNRVGDYLDDKQLNNSFKP